MRIICHKIVYLNKLAASSANRKCPQADCISLDSICLAGISPVAHVWQTYFHSLSSESTQYPCSDSHGVTLNLGKIQDIVIRRKKISEPYLC